MSIHRVIKFCQQKLFHSSQGKVRRIDLDTCVLTQIAQCATELIIMSNLSGWLFALTTQTFVDLPFAVYSLDEIIIT